MDKYSWLRADNWQEVLKDPNKLPKKIRDCIEEENKLIDDYMAPLKDLKDKLFLEMKGRIKNEDNSVPTPDGEYEYYTKYEKDSDYPKFCRHLKKDKKCHVILDFNELSKGCKYFNIGGVDYSEDHEIVSYGLDLKGSEYYEIKFMQMDSKKYLDDVLQDTSGGVVFANDNVHLFYTTLNDNHRANKVWLHKIGTKQEDDILVYHEKNPGYFMGVSKTDDNKYILIEINDSETSEIRYLEADFPMDKPKIFKKRQKGIEYSISHRNGYFYICTNIKGAIDFKICRSKVDDSKVDDSKVDDISEDKWYDFVSHKDGVLQSGFSLYKDYMVRVEKENALPRIIIHDFKTGLEKEISFKEDAYSLGLSGVMEFNNNVFRYSYSSPTTPTRLYEYDMENNSEVLKKEREVPSGHNTEDYICKRLYANSHDNKKIPITILHHKDTKIDGTAPCLLYAYGSYGYSQPATFSTNILSLVERGFVYAIAHVRGGMDCGYKWYIDGKKLSKKNTFKDYISCAEHLISSNYTKEGMLTTMGGSAGGMLVGAVINMRPELFKSAIALVPFVDVLSTISDETLPLTPPEWEEWGNPIKDKEVNDYIKSYSPYDNVSNKNYPHIYVESGLTDPRVTYWEPTKWVKKVKEHNKSDAKILLRTNMGAGHSGATSRWDSLKEIAEIYVFILSVNNLPS